MPFSCEKLAPALLVLERYIFLILYKIVLYTTYTRRLKKDQLGLSRQDKVNKKKAKWYFLI